MKAAVLHNFGEIPHYEEFPDQTPGSGDIVIQVKAVALENVDKAIAKGTHYSSATFFPRFPAIVGHSGIGALPDGTLAGFGGIKNPYGAMAEKVVVPQGYYAPVPQGIDAAVAAALPAPALTSLLAFKYSAKLQPGETVLINGATGIAGMLAVQIAKFLGAGRIVGTGRNEESLKRVVKLGADAVVNISQSDRALAESFKKESGKGYDIIIDFLWGHPTEVFLKTLVPAELNFPKRRIRLVQIGEMAGPAVSLTADMLRTSGLEIYGASAGITPQAVGENAKQVWDWIKEEKIHMDIEKVPLEDIESAWNRTNLEGKRIVIVP